MQTITYEEIVKVQAKGLMTIPKKIRNDFGFEENGLARFKKTDGMLILEPVRTLSYPVRTYTSGDLSDFFALDEKETKDLKKKGLI